jgi:hypothetical protein
MFDRCREDGDMITHFRLDADNKTPALIVWFNIINNVLKMFAKEFNNIPSIEVTGAIIKYKVSKD